MKVVTAAAANKLRKKGLTYQQIGSLLGCHKSVAHRLVAKYKAGPKYKEKIGNKKGRKYHKIWKYIDINWFYEKAEIIAATNDHLVPRSISVDYLIDAAYKTNLKKIKHPKGYVCAVMRNKIKDLYRHKMIKEKYNKKMKEQARTVPINKK